MNMLHVLLVQLPVPNNPATNTPLAAGYLKSYAEQLGLLDRVSITILSRDLTDHAGDAALVEAIVASAPDLLGFSLYTWNSERSLTIAGLIKARLPGVLVVIGGPEVQHENEWALQHPAVDIGVVGEGEQTFAELLLAIDAARASESSSAGTPALSPTLLTRLETIAGLWYRDAAGCLQRTVERRPLDDLSVVPSPYLRGYLEIRPGDLLMVEVSRWCPYACSFCLYGRNMGPRLGGRYFPIERLFAEIHWGRERGVTQVHFIEANLNLVPPFQKLMRALAELNADGTLALYAELRGEHVTEEAADLLVLAGLRVAEVGLQTANPEALRAARRRTDLEKWAAGTRRLYARGVEVLLDVILGLPADDAQGVAQTLAFIERERLGAYDAFTLQVLPGTAVHSEAAAYGLVYQERPPYYVLATDRMPYTELRRLRRELKQGAGIDPDAVEGCPLPRLDALARAEQPDDRLVTRLRFGANSAVRTIASDIRRRLATHVDLIVRGAQLALLSDLLVPLIAANPSTLFDLYLIVEDGDVLPQPEVLRTWRAGLPHTPGYLDRVAVYRRSVPEPGYDRVSPRIWLVAPWAAQIDAMAYAGLAELIWEYHLGTDEEPALAAWERAGGAGVWVRGRSPDLVRQWRESAGILLWEG